MPSFTHSDEHLASEWLAGRSSGFDIVYKTYAPALLRVLLKLVNDPEQAQDLLQDAFLRSWTHRHTYDHQQGRLFTWLVAITRHVALDELRVQKRRLAAIPYLRASFNESCYSTARQGLLGQGLTTQLAPKLREVIDLVYEQDYTRQEIATALSLPIGTVKTRYRMALAQLRRMYGQDVRYYQAS